jgi:cell division protein FtsW
MKFDRQNKNIFTSWWWKVDKLSLVAIILIIVFGAIMVATASPAVAERIGYDSFHFVRKQLVFLSATLVIIIAVSFIPPIGIRRMAMVGFAITLLLMLIVLLFGHETNGAKRWLYIGSFSLQPSEFMKPFFIIVTAWMLSEAKIRKGFKGFQISLGSYLIIAILLISQPDFGMFFVITAVWGGQLFVAGLSTPLVIGIVVSGIFVLLVAYFFFPHVAVRIDSYLAADGNYQVNKSLDAFDSGGFIGRGPGEGVVKQTLPDSHTDFIFAVIGEELGAITCIFIICLYGFVVLRGLKRMMKETDLFYVYAVSGLLMQFGFQAIINMGVALNLLPTKGMTLPFISYGGSSMLAIALAIGMMLALTKTRYGTNPKKQKLVWEDI